MADFEFKTMHRITEIMNEKNFEDEDVKQIYYAFDKLTIFSKNLSENFRKMGEQTFLLNKNEYKEKMQWINDFMKSKGIDYDIFTDTDSFDISSDDYDYYNEYKTPTQYKKDEEERKR